MGSRCLRQEAHEAQLADLKKRFKKISDDVAPCSVRSEWADFFRQIVGKLKSDGDFCVFFNWGRTGIYGDLRYDAHGPPMIG